MTKTRIKKTIGFLNSRTEAEATVAKVAELINLKRSVTAAMDERLLEIKKEYEGQLGDLEAQINNGTEQLQQWALENPAEFGKKKSIAFLAGVIGFRTGTPKLVVLRGWNWKKALEAVQVHLPNFIRQAPEIDKESILAQREELAPALPLVGMKVDQGETFFIEPNLTDAEVQS
jgi:phage host-nuclease inhibitor protein Gam